MKFQVDSEGYTIRKPERKESSSSSGWSSDEDGKPDTYKIKVNIRPAEEAAPISTDQGNLRSDVLLERVKNFSLILLSSRPKLI